MKGNEMKITDYHRLIVTRYYGRLLRRFGLASLLRHIPRLKLKVWTEHGFNLVEKRAAQ
jgi:hypothetical protein